MTTINKTTTAQVQPSSHPQDKAFCLNAAFNLPGKSGKRLTLTFNAAVTYGEAPSG
jgi:hypothetical protein